MPDTLTEPRASTREVDAATVKRWLDAGEAVLIDVREPDEHAREFIPGARNVPLSRVDAAAVTQTPTPQKVVFHCQSGRRSAEALQRAAGGARNELFSLKGGIGGWKAAGLATVVNRGAPIPVMRQVQIVVGAIVLLGSVLAATVSPWFLLLTGFFGLGLLFAGVTGTCGMAAFLGLMPWNRNR
jgi:rhodanese-related sulfurtransferase